MNQPKPPEPRTSFASRFTAAGMPADKSKDFVHAVRRLTLEMKPEQVRAITVIGLAVISVTLYVLGPRILGEATNVIVAGVFRPDGIDFGRLHRIIALAVALYVSSAVLSYLQASLLAGVVQRTMQRLRA
ncbi:MAG: ABC transporter ATP-binding protein, partial [Acidimicrobiales bacterium]|nr:ABC transporter ATP-binding protein [Acidimicrobiales bacterium]